MNSLNSKPLSKNIYKRPLSNLDKHHQSFPFHKNFVCDASTKRHGHVMLFTKTIT